MIATVCAVSRLSEMRCSIARTLDIVGERWTLLILRDIHSGTTRFDAIQKSLGISRKVLAERLVTLEDHGVLERRRYQDNPPRHDYVLTEKGRDLGAVLLSLLAWGDRWAAGPEGPPVLMRHERCGGMVHSMPTCSACGEPLHAGEVTPVPA